MRVKNFFQHKLNQQYKLNEGMQGFLLISGAIVAYATFVFVPIAVMILILLKLVKVSKRRYQLYVILSNEEDPAKRAILKNKIKKLSQKHFELKYKLESAEKKLLKIQNKYMKTKGDMKSPEDNNPKNIMKLQKLKNKYEYAKGNYQYYEGEIQKIKQLKNL